MSGRFTLADILWETVGALNANEKPFVVEVAGKQQDDAEAYRSDREIAAGPEAVADRPAHQALGDVIELDQVPGHEDGQGITADPEERRGPRPHCS